MIADGAEPSFLVPHVALSMRLIECPHNMVAGFPQSELFKREQAEAEMPVMT